jgi:hypothetical protein
MYFLVDTTHKIIFGWTAKCGCSHVKTIFNFFENNNTNEIHIQRDYSDILPRDIENYKTVIFIRNPYKRIVSGLLDKYKKTTQYRNIWNQKYETITFSKFVDELLTNNYRVIDYHHFQLQTSGKYSTNIFNSNTIQFFDIEHIDYTYIEQLYDKKIPDNILTKKFGHERNSTINMNNIINYDVYDLNIDEIMDCNIDIKYFYNEDIKNKIYKFYENDFILFKQQGFDFTIIYSCHSHV